jgi:hypothetical protein
MGIPLGYSCARKAGGGGAFWGGGYNTQLEVVSSFHKESIAVKWFVGL